MTATLIGYARCSTDEQDLTAQRQILRGLVVAEDRIYLDHGLTGTRRTRPGLDQAFAAVQAGDPLVVPELDRLARSVPDAREIGDSLVARGVKSHLLQQHRSGEHTIADLAELFSVSRATVYRVLERQKTTVSSSSRAGQ
ncbi:recombinase family protein [Nocardia sp. CY41]|uniref:recombinase family protein n=1 Tax=Nocardia sp. CY41 TaxID=2608686 RepID=UPI0013593687|nr:recombinase family protein [Nocardia sp. CY41]